MIAQADPPGVDRPRDVDRLVGIDPDNHLPTLGLRGHGVSHRLASSGAARGLARVGGQDCDGPWVRQAPMGSRPIRGIVKLTSSSSIDPQDAGLQPVVNPPCWASKTAVSFNLTIPMKVPWVGIVLGGVRFMHQRHPLKGDQAGKWSVRVSGNWRVVFRFENREVVDVNLIDYH